MKKTLFSGLFLISLTLVFIFGAKYSFAQQSPNYDVTVSPVFFDLSANPGSTVSDKIRVRNNTSNPLSIKLEVKKLTGDDNGDLVIKDENDDNSLSWIKFKEKTFVAKPLEWTDVPFSIEVPKTAAYGYYFAVNFTQENNDKLNQVGTKITGAAAVPILLNVRKNGAKAEVKILNFSTPNYINEYLPINFNIKLENTGNVHVRPRGNIFITSGNNDNIGILDVNQTAANIIPETRRDLTASWFDGFIVKEPLKEDGQIKLDKNGKALEKLTINWNKLTSFRIGKYTANLLLVYDNGKRDIPIEQSITFWVIPYKVIITLLIGLIIFFFVARFIIRFYINKEIKKRMRR